MRLTGKVALAGAFAWAAQATYAADPPPAATAWKPVFVPGIADANAEPNWQAVRGQAPTETPPLVIPQPTVPPPPAFVPMPMPPERPKIVVPPATAEPPRVEVERDETPPPKLASKPVELKPSLVAEPERMPVLTTTTETAASRFFANANYLYGWTNRPRIPALATTAADAGFGYLGDPGTRALLGPGSFGGSGRSGFRVQAGWVPLDDRIGVDAAYHVLGGTSESLRFDSARTPTIARPFFAPNLNQEYAELTAYPGRSTGTLDVRQTSDYWGFELNLRRGLATGENSRSDLFVGYRTLHVGEDLIVRESYTAGATAPEPVGTRIDVLDSFRTANQFHGGQLGWSGSRRLGRATLDGRVAVALGVNRQLVEVVGQQERTRPGESPEHFTGGLLAAGPNLGRFARDQFSVAPEAGINLGFFVLPHAKIVLGYDFQFLSGVVRPGDQIDRTVNLTFVPNAPAVAASGLRRPQVPFRNSDFQAQGLRLGFELTW